MKVQPHFFIIGAMKAGTTTLHQLLEQHPNIYFPQGETKFFTIDDFEQQPQFFPYLNEKWTNHNFELQNEKYWKWYQGLYSDVKNETILGEDAPSYLSSKKAVQRIAEYFPDIKLIIVLRDPVERIWSHYWHNVRNFSAYFSFEETIRYAPNLIVQRSFYKEQIEEYLKYFNIEQFKFLIFEDFIKNQQSVATELFEFLNLPPIELNTIHANKSKYPRFLKLRLWRNKKYKFMNGRNYFSILPDMPTFPKLTIQQRVLLKLEKNLNESNSYTIPKMNFSTREFLSNLLYKENKGLENILEMDLEKFWPSFRKKH